MTDDAAAAERTRGERANGRREPGEEPDPVGLPAGRGARPVASTFAYGVLSADHTGLRPTVAAEGGAGEPVAPAAASEGGAPVPPSPIPVADDPAMGAPAAGGVPAADGVTAGAPPDPQAPGDGPEDGNGSARTKDPAARTKGSNRLRDRLRARKGQRRTGPVSPDAGVPVAETHVPRARQLPAAPASAPEGDVGAAPLPGLTGEAASSTTADPEFSAAPAAQPPGAAELNLGRDGEPGPASDAATREPAGIAVATEEVSEPRPTLSRSAAPDMAARAGGPVRSPDAHEPEEHTGSAVPRPTIAEEARESGAEPRHGAAPDQTGGPAAGLGGTEAVGDLDPDGRVAHGESASPAGPARVDQPEGIPEPVLALGLAVEDVGASERPFAPVPHDPDGPPRTSGPEDAIVPPLQLDAEGDASPTSQMQPVGEPRLEPVAMPEPKPTVAREPQPTLVEEPEPTPAVEREPAPTTGREAGTSLRAVAALPQRDRAAEDEDRPIIAPPPTRRPAAQLRDLRPDPAGPRDGRAVPTRGRRERTDEARDEREEAGARMRRARRIEGGGTVMIADALFPLHDWSTGGIAIASDGHRFRVGDRAQLELELDLGDYAVNLDLEGEVMNRSPERTGWRFIDPTPRQAAVLDSLAAACLDDRAFVAPRARRIARTTRVRSRPRRLGLAWEVLSLPFNSALIAIFAGAAIIGIEGGKLPTVPFAAELRAPVEAAHAAVAVERIGLVADRPGIILEWGAAPGEAVDNGEALVSLSLDDPNAEADRDVVVSPCDCFLARILAEPGMVVDSGDELALLYRRGAAGYVQALFAPEEAPSPGDTVTVELPYSNSTFEGIVESIGRLDAPERYIGLPLSVAKRGSGLVFARIRTDPPVSPALAGDPATVTVVRPGA